MTRATPPTLENFMQTLPRLRTVTIVLAGLSLALFAGALAFADQPEVKQKKGQDAAAEAPAPAVPSEKVDASAQGQTPDVQAKVTPEAKQLIDQVDAAYAKIQKLELGGTFSADLDAASTQRKETKNFTATYAAPNKFRHSMQDDIVVGSTGDKTYAYLEANKKFTQADPPKDKPRIEQLPEPIPGVLQMQNPALVLAVVKSAAAELTSTFTDISKVEDSKLAGEQAAYPTLRLTLPNKMVVTMLFHPETHLLRQSRTDIKPMLEDRGTPDVKNASLVVDYTKVLVNETAGVKDEQFAWAPPEGARDQAEAPAEVADAGEASVLEGKPAPA